jgi:hypothetical protein
VTTLNVTHLNRYLIDWMMANINLPRIVDVKLWNCDFGSDAITSLLSCTPNINSLRFSFNLLTSKQTAIIINCDGLKRLDISGDRHTFTEEDVSTFARLFPHVEHLEINTISLYNLPLLNVYLPTSSTKPYFQDYR